MVDEREGSKPRFFPAQGPPDISLRVEQRVGGRPPGRVAADPERIWCEQADHEGVLPRVAVPDSRGAVVACGGELSAVGVVGDGGNPIGVAGEGGEQGGGIGVPDSCCAVKAGRGELGSGGW